MRTGKRNVPPAQLTSTSVPSANARGIHGDVRLGCQFGDSRRCETEFLGAEDVMHRHQQPLTLARFECGGDSAEVRLAVGRRGLEDANSRIAATQRSADLFLIGIHRLNGIPAGRPEERNESSGRLLRRAFHGKRQRRIGIAGRRRLGNVDIHEHGGTPALAVRRARNLGSGDAKCGRGRGAAHRRRARVCARDIAASTSSRSASDPASTNASLPATSFCGTNTWKNRWARPSLLTKVPSDSAKVPAGRTRSALRVVGLSR